MPPQPPMPVAPPQGNQFPTPEDLAQIERDTGYNQERIMQDVQQTGATSKETLYPQVYGDQAGIDPAVAQGASGMPMQNAQPTAAPPMPPQSSGLRAQAQAAMAGQPAPEEQGESPSMQSAEMMPGGGENEGIQPAVAAAAHSNRPAPMHRAMKGKPQHHPAGKPMHRRV